MRSERTNISNSISPVNQHDAEQAPAQMVNQELVETEEGDEEKGDPVPESHEETKQPRIGRRPIAPTKAEIEEHYPLHLEYRSWCEHCRAGKARQSPHRIEPQDRERLGITFHADYAFTVPEEKGEEM